MSLVKTAYVTYVCDLPRISSIPRLGLAGGVLMMTLSQHTSSVFSDIMWHLVICRGPRVESLFSRIPSNEGSALNTALDSADVGLNTWRWGLLDKVVQESILRSGGSRNHASLQSEIECVHVDLSSKWRFENRLKIWHKCLELQLIVCT